MLKSLTIIPVVIFLFFISVFIIELTRDDKNKETFFNESALIGKDMPKFSLPSVYDGYLGLNYNDFGGGGYRLVNIFASWCVACLAEHPLLMKLKENKTIPILGIAWKDKPANTRSWLKMHGNPYDKVGADLSGEAAIALGITGAPESFVVDATGKIIFHHLGPLDEDTISDKITPLVQ